MLTFESSAIEPVAILERQDRFERVSPAVVNAFSSEFCSLLADARSHSIGPDGVQKLNALLDSFEDLVQQMRTASRDIRSLLSESPSR